MGAGLSEPDSTEPLGFQKGETGGGGVESPVSERPSGGVSPETTPAEAFCQA